MPLVNIQLVEGRTIAQKEAAAKAITEAIVKNLGAPASAVQVIFSDMKEGDFYEAGEMRKVKK
ncbi:MAG: tautomerase family protein [Streptococcaceae bacterium]|jgi:4-oxalocrotonate tautomerase|nr:tautomerase family protein [Streptococcaceae bacterium]